MKGRLKHLREQIEDAKEQRAGLAASMIHAKTGVSEALRMFDYVARRMRRQMLQETSGLRGSAAEIRDSAYATICATLDSISRHDLDQSARSPVTIPRKTKRFACPT